MTVSQDAVQGFAAFDITEKDHRRNVEPLWTLMRSAPTLPHSQRFGGFLILTRFEDVAAVARNPKDFSSAENGIAIPDLSAGGRLLPVESDPPCHTEYRSLFAPLVTREAMSKHEPMLRNLSRELLASCIDREKFDFVVEVARPFPAFAVLKILGVRDADVHRLAHLVDLAVDGAEGEGRGGPGMLAAGRELNEYLAHILDQHRAAVHDPSNIVSTIVHTSLPTAPLGRKEQLSLLKIFIFGGFTTTTFALTSAIRWLLEHPADLDRLRDEPQLMTSAVDEFVRFASPGTYVARTAMRDTTIGRTSVPKGTRVLLSYGAANRDPTVFDRPDDIVLDRPVNRQSANRHVGFGTGPHGCMGIHLARLELQVALQECLIPVRDYEVDPDATIEWSSGETEGMSRLPLRKRV